MGFVLLGIATLTATGLQAALIGNIAHGIITGLLFFLAGAIKDRAHTGELAELGGLRERRPAWPGCSASPRSPRSGLPGLAGFWGEAFAVVAAVRRGGALWTTLAVLAAIGGALTAAYFLRLLRRVTHGPAGPPWRPRRTATWPGCELGAWAPLVLLALAVGLVPALVLAVAVRAGRGADRGGVGDRSRSTTSRCCRCTWPPAPRVLVLLADCWSPGRRGPVVATAALGAVATAVAAVLDRRARRPRSAYRARRVLVGRPPRAPRSSAVLFAALTARGAGAVRARAARRARAGRRVLLPAGLLDDRRRGARRTPAT